MVRKVSLLSLLIILVVSSAYAGVKPGDGLLTVNVGYAAGTSVYTGETIDGGIIGLDYQKLGWNSPWSGGFSIGYGQLTEDFTNIAGGDTTQVNTTLTSMPIYLGGRYWLGGGEKRVQGYLGLAFGMYFAQLDTKLSTTTPVQGQPVSGEYSSETGLGFGLGIPVGVAVSLGESVLVTANYTLNWLWESEFLDSDILNSFSLGIAFRFGD